MKRFFITFVSVAIALVASSTFAKGKPPFAPGKPGFAGPPGGATIVETAIALSGTPNEFDENGDDFDILVAAVIATGINESVLNGEYDYTVFAPNDKAFLDTCSAITKTEVTDEEACFNTLASALTVDGVAAVLAYHVAEGVRNSRSVSMARSVKMLDGNRISVNNGTIEAENSDAGFVATDILVADGMIHIIDFVLLP